jgi:hypothetical protein
MNDWMQTGWKRMNEMRQERTTNLFATPWCLHDGCDFSGMLRIVCCWNLQVHLIYGSGFQVPSSVLFIMKRFIFTVYVFVLLHVLYISLTISWSSSFPNTIRVSVGEGTILKWFMKRMWWYELESFDSGQRSLTDCCKHGTELLAF